MALGYVPTNFPNGVTSFGVLLPWGAGGYPPVNSNGATWFVSSTLGNNGNPGSFDKPFATLAFALQNSNLSINDTIVLEEGHVESVTAAGTATAGILAATAGVNIIGLGNGTTAPTITFTTATTATFKITGAGVSVQGIRFVCGINSQVTMLDIQAKSVVIAGNTFTDDGTHTGLSFIDLVNASANASDGLRIISNNFYNPTAGNYNHAIGLTTVQDNVEIGCPAGGKDGNYVFGTFALSGIHNITGKVMTNLRIHDNYVRNITAATPAMNFISACTGQLYGNRAEPGDSTVASIKLPTSNVLDVSGQNTGINGSLDAGSEFWYVKKGVVSSTITTAGVAISAASIGGELAIKNVVTKTDPTTGLAGTTTLKLQSNNVNGALIIMQTTNVGTSASTSMVPLNTGTSAISNANVLETGKVLSLSALTTNGTGAGTVDVYVLLQRLTAGANLSAV